MLWESAVYKLTTETGQERRQFLGGSLRCISVERGHPITHIRGKLLFWTFTKAIGGVQNPFYWKEVVLNLPPDTKYDPSLPQVIKLSNDG